MKKFANTIFGIDFDGTCVYHCFPEIGEDVEGAELTLNYILNNGGKLVLNTMRSDRPDRNHLQEAVDWFEKKSIPLHGINKNPTQAAWTSSPKVYAHVYIDDAALGCPLQSKHYLSDRPFVDWYKVLDLLEDM